MAFGDKWETKSIIHIEVVASSKERAQRKWDQTLEKIKYQVDGVIITEQLEPNWILKEKQNDSSS